MNKIEDYDFSGKRALIRVDFNVPVKDGVVTDETRINAALPTIQHVLANEGSVVLMSHLGRPSESREEKYSLRPVEKVLQAKLGIDVLFATDCIGPEVETMANSLAPGQVLLLENLRFHSAEKAGDPTFAAQLAKLGQAYINDAFGTAHRKHASTSVIATSFPSDRMFGMLMDREVSSITSVMDSAQSPLTAIIGGAKVSSKLPVILSLLDKVDNLIIGGGMAYTFTLAQGGKVGNSLVEKDMVGDAQEILSTAQDKGVNLYLPTDSVIADAFSNDAEVGLCDMNEIPDGWLGTDIGPDTIKLFHEVLLNSKTILWNGPVGVFEMPRFAEGTKAVAQSVATATANGAFSLVGGGDSVAAINQTGLANQVSYVSTGGGALLEMLEGKVLPGVAAIQE